jgi:ABC-type Mn2+/Zn2+ transport system ATPase subunit
MIAGRRNGTGVAAGTRPSTPSLRAERLTVGYDGRPVLQEITLEMDKGQSLALVGMNGSGKSTLLKTIVGLLPRLGGRLEVLGARPGGAPGRVAYLSQSHSTAFVLPLRAVDVVRMGRFAARGLLGSMSEEDDDRVFTAMQRMGIGDLANAPLRSLSGGQQQRVYLAQVFAHDADLLVLDEPAASLDAAGKEIYDRAVTAELARGAAVVVATHDIREAARCDLAMLLAHRVVALGPARDVITPDALLETFGIILVSQDQAGGLAVIECEHGHDCD